MQKGHPKITRGQIFFLQFPTVYPNQNYILDNYTQKNQSRINKTRTSRILTQKAVERCIWRSINKALKNIKEQEKKKKTIVSKKRTMGKKKTMVNNKKTKSKKKTSKRKSPSLNFLNTHGKVWTHDFWYCTFWWGLHIFPYNFSCG